MKSLLEITQELGRTELLKKNVNEFVNELVEDGAKPLSDSFVIDRETIYRQSRECRAQDWSCRFVVDWTCEKSNLSVHLTARVSEKGCGLKEVDEGENGYLTFSQQILEKFLKERGFTSSRRYFPKREDEDYLVLQKQLQDGFVGWLEIEVADNRDCDC